MAQTPGSDNPFPSVLFAEHVDPANPSAGTQRLFVDTDHLLKLRDSAGTVTTFPTSAGSGTVTTVEEVDGSPTNSAVTKIVFPNGTLGIVGTVATYTPAAAGYLGTRTEFTLSGDVTMTTANTFYDGPTSGSAPTAGVYDVWGRIAFVSITAGETYYVARLIANGSSVIDEVQGQWVQASSSQMVLYLSARVTANGTDPILIRGTATYNGHSIKRDPTNNSSGIHRASLLVLTRVS